MNMKLKRTAFTTAAVLICGSMPLAVAAVKPADMVPSGRPRIVLSAAELPKRIEWARPGGPLNRYLEELKKTRLR